MRMKAFAAALSAAAFFALPACGQTQSGNTDSKMNTNSKSLVVYFSRADENYAVGNITEGNTAIIGKMIADQAGADTFHIQPATPYPAEYDPCTEIAKTEKETNARPDIIGDVNVEAYDTIYIGYPIWWGDAPMPVYTFIEKHDWSGKTVIPFVTHEGSGVAGSDRLIGAACKGATIGKPFEIYGHVAQQQRDKAREAVTKFLNNK